MYEHAYIVGALFFLVTWAVLFAFLPKSRKPILWTSFALGHAGPISQYWHLRDYWSPVHLLKIQIGDWTFGVEDYIFSFAFSGLCAGVFDFWLRRYGREELTKFRLSGFIKLVVFGLVFLSLMGILNTILHLNSLHAILISLFCCGCLISIRRRPWVFPSIMTSGIIALYMWAFYWGFYTRVFPDILQKWWKADSLSLMFICGVPVEEVIWAAVASFFCGPAIRYCMEVSKTPNFTPGV